MRLSFSHRGSFLPSVQFGCTGIRRSQRKGVIEIVLRPLIAQWDCETCGHRFYAFR